MSREIKFRAWVKPKYPMEEKMVFGDSLKWRDGEFITGVLNFEETEIVEEWEILQIMQYTGLKDKNGKEIYEGDIIKKGKHIGVVEYCNLDAKYLIVWKLNNPNITMGADGLGSTHPYPYMENIGNIYENSEILTL